MKTKKNLSNKISISLENSKDSIRKEKIRKLFLKLRNKELSCAQCKKRLKTAYDYDVTIRTLERWDKRFKETKWNLKDSSKRPKTIHYKVTPEIKKKIIFIGNKTGWGEYKIAKLFPDISHTTINKVLKTDGLFKKEKKTKSN